MKEIVVSPGLSSEILLSSFTEDVYGEKEKDPKPQKKTINKFVPVGSISLSRSYQYP